LNLLIEKLKKNHSKLVFFIFFLYFLIGIVTFQDYGISIDEKFQRLSGFYWLNYLLSFTNFEHLKEIVDLKILSTTDYTLPSLQQNLRYSIFFDVPSALIEVIFKIEESKTYFEIRHFFNFFIFFLSSIYFYKLLKNRFINYSVSIIGTVFYMLSPKIYGASFYNNKDIVFLSLLVISIYFFFKTIDSLSYKNIIFLSAALAAATTFRIIGIFFPLMFLIFYFFSVISKKNELVFLPKIVLFAFLFFLFLYIFWPYLWNSPVKNFISIFNVGEMLIKMKILFNGNYVNSNFLPISYLITWIIISTPVIHLILFFSGLFFCLKRFLLRFINLEKNKNGYDLWRGKNEKKDLLILFSLILIPLYLIYSQIIINNSWRHLYFLNIFLIYFVSYSIYIFSLKLKNNKYKFFFNILIIIALIHVGNRMIIYHPYQSTYFNFLISPNLKNKFEVDYMGLTGVKFLREVLELEKDNDRIIGVAVASFLPLHNSLDMLKKNEKQRITVYGNEYNKADYIYSNFISEVDKSVDKKYKIPNNFTHLYTFNIYGANIYSVYKKNKN
jgi:hypothetical protein